MRLPVFVIDSWEQFLWIIFSFCGNVYRYAGLFGNVNDKLLIVFQKIIKNTRGRLELLTSIFIDTRTILIETVKFNNTFSHLVCWIGSHSFNTYSMHMNLFLVKTVLIVIKHKHSNLWGAQWLSWKIVRLGIKVLWVQDLPVLEALCCVL